MKTIDTFITESNTSNSNSVVFAFGRFNPPTIGHEKLVNKLLDTAKLRGIKNKRLYLSHNQDSTNNPLSFSDRLSYCLKAFGNSISIPQDTSLTSPFHVFEKLIEQGYTHIILVCGSDRVSEYQQKFQNHINRHRLSDITFEVVNAGIRDKDLNDISSSISGSSMRLYAVQGDFDNFKKGLPSKLQSCAREVYDNTRKGLRIESMTVVQEDSIIKAFSDKLKRYHVNPTVNEIMGIMRRDKNHTVNFLQLDGKLYAWRGSKLDHRDFMRKELMYDKKQIDDVLKQNFAREGVLSLHPVNYDFHKDDYKYNYLGSILYHKNKMVFDKVVEKMKTHILPPEFSDVVLKKRRDRYDFHTIPLNEGYGKAISKNYTDIGHNVKGRNDVYVIKNTGELIVKKSTLALSGHLDNFPDIDDDDSGIVAWGRIDHDNKQISLIPGWNLRDARMDKRIAVYAKKLHKKYSDYTIITQKYNAKGLYIWEEFKETNHSSKKTYFSIGHDINTLMDGNIELWYWNGTKLVFGDGTPESLEHFKQFGAPTHLGVFGPEAKPRRYQYGRIDHKKKVISMVDGESSNRPSNERKLEMIAKKLLKKFGGYKIYMWNHDSNKTFLFESLKPINNKMDYWDIGHGSVKKHGDVELYVYRNGKIEFHPLSIGVSVDSNQTHNRKFNTDAYRDYYGRIEHPTKKISLLPNVNRYYGIVDERKTKHVAELLKRKYPSYKIYIFDQNNTGVYLYEEQQEDLLMEGYNKGIKIPYLETISASDILRFLRRTQYKSIRMITYNGRLFVWDAADGIHKDFIKYELLPKYNLGPEDFKEIYRNTQNRGIIDPLISHEGNFFGDELFTKHTRTIQKLMTTLEKMYKKQFIPMNNNGDFLFEGRREKGTTVDGFYWENPSNEQLLGFMQRLPMKTARFFSSMDHKLYFWDGASLIHFDFAHKELGMTREQAKFTLNMRNTGILSLSKKRNGYVGKLFLGEYVYYTHKKFFDGFMEYLKTFHNTEFELVSTSLGQYTYKITPSKKNKNTLNESLSPEITYITNPSANQIVGAIKKAKYNTVRLLIDKDGTVYMWEAYGIIHSDFARFILKKPSAEVYELAVKNNSRLGYFDKDSINYECGIELFKNAAVKRFINTKLKQLHSNVNLITQDETKNKVIKGYHIRPRGAN